MITGLLLACLCLTSGANAMDSTTTTGEPYVLAGRRIVLTNWHYVRPGSFAWIDADGNNVTVAGAAGPFDAHLARTDYPHGIRIVTRPAERVGPVVDMEMPWEAGGVSLDTVIQVDGTFRAWGQAERKRGEGVRCYFESEDGLHWTRPNLGLVEWEGSRENNLLDSAPGTVFLDPSAPDDERYKWVDLRDISNEQFEAHKQQRPDDWEPRAIRSDVGHVYAMLGGVSPDGIHWRQLDDPLIVEHSDTQPVAYYDSQLGKYVLYTRNWSVGERAPGAPDDQGLSWIGVGRRSIGRSESDDFRRFPLSEVILEPGPELLPSDTIYTNCKTTIPGAPDQHLLFPTIWHTSDDSTSVTVASSWNGRVWHWLPGGMVLDTAEFGRFDGGCVFAHPNLVELPSGDWALPYTGYVFPHKYSRGAWSFQPGMAVWPKGRLIGLEAEDRGEFATVAFMPPGQTLRINAVTKRGGSLLVEVAHLGGGPVGRRTFDDCDAIVGDHHWAPVTWGGEEYLGWEEGESIMLRFRMEKAVIYGLEFE